VGLSAVRGLPLLLLLGACGLAVPKGADSARKPRETHPFSVATAVLPDGQVAKPYATAQLGVTDPSTYCRWRLWTGSLPPGLSLAETGTITGTPTQGGAYVFSVLASDGVDAATRDLGIAVDGLGIVTEGLNLGDAWTGTTISLHTIGAKGTVRFEVVSAASGGRFLSLDGAAGKASWAPGYVAGTGITDRLRAIDDGSGRTVEVSLPVMPNPVPWMRAEFGTTDVWYVRFTGKTGTHFFASDFDYALSRAGLRAPTSIWGGTTAERVASFCVRREMIRRLNTLYLRDPEGVPGAGLAISFPIDPPDPAYARAAPGEALAGDPGHYSVISLVGGTAPGLYGKGIQDSAVNDSHENDTSSAVYGELGVFVNLVVTAFDNSWVNDQLVSQPVSDADLPALRAIAYGLPSPGGRYTELRRVIEGLGRVLGDVCGHEIGHGLGLVHTSPSRVGSLMNAEATIIPTVLPAFTPEDLDALSRALPGRGRTFGSSKPSPVLVPEADVISCGLPDSR
jgi:hypothetical protein